MNGIIINDRCHKDGVVIIIFKTVKSDFYVDDGNGFFLAVATPFLCETNIHPKSLRYRQIKTDSLDYQ